MPLLQTQPSRLLHELPSTIPLLQRVELPVSLEQAQDDATSHVSFTATLVDDDGEKLKSKVGDQVGVRLETIDGEVLGLTDGDSDSVLDRDSDRH